MVKSFGKTLHYQTRRYDAGYSRYAEANAEQDM